MGEMVERAADAIDVEMERQCNENPTGPWDSDAIAIAVLNALREPAPEMLEAYDAIAIEADGAPAQFSHFAWNKAIDAALSKAEVE